MESTPEIAALASRLEALSQVCARLGQENAELRDRVSRLGPGRTARPAAAADRGGADNGVVSLSGAAASGERESRDGKVSRRMIGKAIGAAAAGVVGTAVLVEATAGPAAASDGNAITAGNTTTAELATTVKYDGTGGPGVVFLANDTGFAATEASAPAALGGWGGTKVPNGIYGYTNFNGTGDAVVGINSAHGGSGVHGIAESAAVTGVTGTGPGTAVAGTSSSTAADASAVIGTISSTSPGGFSAGVRGINNGTGGLGIGVYGTQNGSGWGVFGLSVSGFGVYGSSESGTGVNAQGVTGLNASGSVTGVTATGGGGTGTGVTAHGGTAVHASGGRVGVSASGPVGVASGGSGTNGIGVNASAGGSNGRGGVFAGTAAQVQLSPGKLTSHPKSGKTGDLYADAVGRLWFCKKGGTAATWHQVA